MQQTQQRKPLYNHLTVRYDGDDRISYGLYEIDKNDKALHNEWSRVCSQTMGQMLLRGEGVAVIEIRKAVATEGEEGITIEYDVIKSVTIEYGK